MPTATCIPTSPTCTGCPLPSNTEILVISLVVTLSVAWLFVDAFQSKRGLRWVSTMVGGVLFGEVVEALNTHDVPFLGSAHIYCYPDLPINVLGVPFWVPLGWGGIIYAATWTAQRLKIPPIARPVAAAFLAVSIDFSLDPIAELMGFWHWQHYDVNFVAVPYDNFIGWYLIVFIYSLTAAWILRRTKARWNVDAEPFSPAWRWSVGIEALAPILCAVVATAALVLFKLALSRLTSYSADDGSKAATIFIVVTTIGALVTLALARRPVADDDPPVNWPVMIVPAVMHLTCYVLFLSFAKWQDAPMLVATIPIQLLAGLFVFSTPWRRQLSLTTPAAPTPAQSTGKGG